MSISLNNKGNAEKIKSFLEKHNEEIYAHSPKGKKMVFFPLELYHYTSMETLFNLLENDSLWFFSLPFSNDLTEEKIVGKEKLKEINYQSDNFAFSLSADEGDTLSQWRGYCNNGGASIGFHFDSKYTGRVSSFSVLHADYEFNKKFHIVTSVAVPVIYLNDEIEPLTETSQFVRDRQKIVFQLLEYENKSNGNSLKESWFVPLFKLPQFCQEKEFRVILSNSDDKLSECIRFKSLKNGTKIPFIVVKHGFIKDSTKRERLIEKNLTKICNNPNMPGVPVLLPNCRNQSELHSAMWDFLREKNPEDPRPIICEGHLPIVSITIAPMADQNRIAEQVSRFCKSKYWLRTVKILTSKIPYAISMNS
ncbi:MAG: DUF2971 domain-containing protein [Spirochaetaceae bacterium]|jgi:hypothetical protein|nr:DUF2971 domain-containing protein [Spirochaetaceae bacterium]